MSKNRKIIDTEMGENTNIKEQIHEDRRDETRESFEEGKRRAANKKKERVPVWIKQEVLDYEDELSTLQIELLKMQRYIKEKELKLLVIFEGRDAAGKGGTIKRITEHINPRGARVVALNKPSDVEKTQWYFQRYIQHLPNGGEIVLFDRSWYNRGGVEPVLGFCTQEEHQNFLLTVPLLERMLVNAGIILIKLYFSISKDEEEKRFKERSTNPLKQYKLSPTDQYSQTLWDQYTMAEHSMFMASHTEIAPWRVIESNNKKKARINAIKHILNQIDYPDKLKKKKLKENKKISFSANVKIAEFDKLFLTRPPQEDEKESSKE